MPVLVNSIGAHTFFDLTGAIFYRQEELEIINRPGVTGSGLRRLGVRGEPFTLTSITYHADWAAAKTALEAYDNLPGAAAQTVTRNGVNHGTYLVLRVLEVETRPVLTVAGVGVPSTHQIRQVVRWQLLG